MDSLSSDTEEDSESRNEPDSSKDEDLNDGVSIKSKIAPAAYDDDDNFDDLLADLPADDNVAPPAAIEASPELVEEEEEPSEDRSKSASPMRSPSPDQEAERTRSPTPERKDSRGSDGSSSFDERASSLSPEPPKVIAAPTTKVTSPLSPGPLASQSRASPITKIYTDKIVNNVDSDSEEAGGKVARQKPTGDITQIYTQKLVNSQESPKPERAKFVRPSRDITQLYTAALHKEDRSPARAEVEGLPKRTGDITKLYTGGLGGVDGGKAFKGKPNDERTNPTKVQKLTTFFLHDSPSEPLKRNLINEIVRKSVEHKLILSMYVSLGLIISTESLVLSYMTFKSRIFMNGASMIINVLIGKHQTSLLTIKVNKNLSATDKDRTKHL